MPPFLWIVQAALLSLVCLAAAAPSRIVSANRSLFVDELGRSRIFRGTNVVGKTSPYVPNTSVNAPSQSSFNQNDVNVLAENGVTAIRLGVMWPGVEPTQGSYNQTYLAQLTNIVQMCSDAGIYVLLDFHQDSFTEKFCGQGVPGWAVTLDHGFWSQFVRFPVPLTLPYSVDENDLPTKEECGRFDYAVYQSTFVSAQYYQFLYTNANGLTDRFIAFWKLVAQTFLPFKNILGYDMINEPFWGNFYNDSSLFDPLYANEFNLLPFYDNVSAAIRSVDPNALIHFEPVTFVEDKVGFPRVPQNASFGSKSVLNFHYYKSAQALYDLNQTLGFRVDEAGTLGCGAILTEFEMGYGNLANIPSVFQAADVHLISALGWEYKEYNANAIENTGVNDGLVDPNTGTVRQDFAKAISRPYAHTTAGTPTSMLFNDTTKNFTLVFAFNGASGDAGTTEIRGNFNLQFPNGFSVKIASANGNFTASSPAGLNGVVNSVVVAPVEGSIAKSGTDVRIEIS